MDFELGLKITKPGRDDRVSANLQITKDRASPLFLSTETETMFILKSHVQGFQLEMIKIGINKDGSELEILAEMPAKEMMMGRRKKCKNQSLMRGFRKIFRIPDGVVLDRIKARFNDEEAILMIFMPKYNKGLQGVSIEEVLAEEIPKRQCTTQKFRPEQGEAEPKRTEEIEGGVEPSTQVDKGIQHESNDRHARREGHSTETETKTRTDSKENMEVESARERDGTGKTEPLPSEKSLRGTVSCSNRDEGPKSQGKLSPKELVKDNPEPADSTRDEQAKMGYPISEASRAAPGEMPAEVSKKFGSDADAQEMISTAPALDIEQTKIAYASQDIKREGNHGKCGSATENQIQAEASENETRNSEESEANQCKTVEADEKGDTDPQVTPNKHISLKLFMGSALLASLVAVAVGLIKARKREKHC